MVNCFGILREVVMHLSPRPLQQRHQLGMRTSGQRLILTAADVDLVGLLGVEVGDRGDEA